MIRTPSPAQPRFKSVSVISGDQCVANCADCFTESSPKGRRWLSPEEVSRLGAWIARVGDPEHFSVSGGEPTLNMPLLDSLVALSPRSRIRIVTNGWWGPHSKVASEFIALIVRRGVSVVQMSLGPAHGPWISPEAIAASVILLLSKTDASVQLLLEYESESGEDEHRAMARFLADMDPVRVEVHRTPWARRIGNAYWSPAVEPSLSFCEQLNAPRIVVDVDGSVYRCCGTHLRTAPLHSAFYLGSLRGGFVVPFSPNDRYADHFRKVARCGAPDPPLPEGVPANLRPHPCTACIAHTASAGHEVEVAHG